VIRVERATGTITTICGPEGKWFTNPDAEDALVVPTSVAIAPDGRLVIVDTGANLVRVLPAGSY
jgi:DNA-binding beta-propeller fold protein YncE